MSETENSTFKLNGIYARKIDPKKELTNYNPTKLGSIWKAASGKKEKEFYEIIQFIKIHNPKYKFENTTNICVDYSNMYGDIFELTDGRKSKGCSKYSKYKNLELDTDRFKFGNETINFSGVINEDLLYLYINHNETGDTISHVLRFIPWI